MPQRIVVALCGAVAIIVAGCDIECVDDAPEAWRGLDKVSCAGECCDYSNQVCRERGCNGCVATVCNDGCVAEWAEKSMACERTVDYTLTCEDIVCHAADDFSDYDSPTYQSFTCVWSCADYDGRTDVYVSLTFSSTPSNPCWTLENEYVSGGICGSG